MAREKGAMERLWEKGSKASSYTASKSTMQTGAMENLSKDPFYYDKSLSKNSGNMGPVLSRYEEYYRQAASAAPYAPAQKSMSLPDQLAETEKQLKAVRDRNTQAKRSRSGTEDTVTERQLRQQVAQLRAEKNWAESDAYTASGTKALGELSAGSRAYLETLAKLGGGAYQTPDTDYFAGSMSGRYDNGTVFDVDPATYAENADVQKARIALRRQGYSDGEIEQLVDYRRRQINREDYDTAVERMRQYAAERPVGASATSVLTNMGGGFGTLDALHQKITHPERPVDFYSPEMAASGMTNAIRGQVSQDIRDNAKTELGGKVGSFLYQTGMSMADSGVNALMAMAGLPQGVGLTMLGGSASTTAMREAKERGLTDNQALGMGLVAGAAEIVTEKIGLDTFLDTAFGKGGKRAAVAILKNVLAEGGEEVGSDVINLAADVLIAKDQSEWSQSIAAYMKQGMSREAATRRAILDQLGSMAVSFAGGALSGGVFGSVGVGINNIRAKGLYGADSAALVQEALDIDPENKTAQRAQERLNKGKSLPGNTLLTLAEINEDAISRNEAESETAANERTASEEERERLRSEIVENSVATDGPLRYEVQLAGDGKYYGSVTTDGNTAVDKVMMWRPYVYNTEGYDSAEKAVDDMLAHTAESDTNIKEEMTYESGSTGQERNDRVYGQQEPAQVEKGPGRFNGQQQRNAAESLRAAVRVEGVGQTRAVKLGISEAKSTSTVQVVPEKLYTEELRSVAQRNSKDGVKTVFVVGAIELKDGSIARGAVSEDGKTIWIRADHASFSATQLNDHETFHRLAKRDPDLVQRTAERITQRFGDDDLANMMMAYADAYRGAELDTNAILEEILADAYAGMNALGYELYGAGDATRYTEETVTSAVESHNMRNVLAQNTEAKENTAPEGGVKYSLEFLKDNDLSDYIESGSRKNIGKIMANAKGEKVMLTSSAEIKKYITDAIAGKALKTVGYAKVGKRLVDDARSYSNGNIDTTGYYMELVASDLKHAWDQHHIAKQPGDIDLTIDDFMSIADYIANYDDLIYAMEYASGKKSIATGTSVGNGKAVVIQVVSKSRGALQFKNMIGVSNAKYQREYINRYKKRSTASTRGSESSNISLPNANASTDSIRNSPEKSNNKFSRDIVEGDMRRENEGLQRMLEAMTERKDYYKAQSQQTHTFVSPAIVKRMAEEYVKNTSLEAGEIRADLQELGNFMHGPHKNADFYKDAKDRAAAIAEKIVSNARELTNPDEVAAYRELRRDLREHPVQVSEEVRRDFTDWSVWRSGNRAVAIQSEGTPVDVRYEELRERYGEYYFPRDVVNPADQLRQIGKAVEMMGPKFSNPNSYYMAAATEIMANQILRDMVHPTKTDRLIARMKEEAKAGKEAAVTRERQKWERRVGEMVTKQKAQKERQREQRLSSRYREKIRKVANDFRQMILHPTDSRYAPKELMASCLQVAMMLDTSGEREDTKAKAKFNEQMRRLTEQYEDLEKNQDTDYSMEYDAEFAYMVKQLQKRLNGKAIRDLSAAELEDVYLVLHDINEMLKQAKFQIGKADKITNYSVGESIIRQQQSYGSKVRTRAQQLYDSTMRVSANPMRNIRRMTEHDDNAALARLFRDLNEGIRKKNTFVMNANKEFDRFAGERMRKAATEYKLYEFENGAARMTEMQVMQVILSWEREAVNGTTQHLSKGGILIPDAKLMEKRKGREAIRLGQTVTHIQKEDIDTLYAGLDEWAKDYMDAARTFFNETAQDAINEATMQIKHRRIATTRNYIPFEIDKDTVAQEIEGVKYDAAIEGIGMLKSVQEGAANTLVMRGLNEIIDRHIEKVGQVYGLAVPIKNYNKALAVKMIGTHVTARKSIQSDDMKLMDQVITDLQTPRRRDTNTVTKVMDTLQDAFVKSTLLSNVSVTIKQAASYSTAGLYLSQKALFPYQTTVAKLFANNDSAFARALFAEIDEHTAAHYIRRKGMSLQEAAMIAQSNSAWVRWMDEHIKNDALNPLKWIQNMDVATTAALWLACKRQVEMDGTTASVDGYWEKVTSLYEQVIEDTQPMYDVLHRPEIQRTTDSLVRSVLMFKTQPLQNAGIIWDAVGNYQTAKKSGKGVEQARKKLGRAVGSQVASLAVFACMSFLAYAAKNRLGRYKDEEGEVTPQSIAAVIFKDMANNASGLIIPLFGTELFSAVDGIVQRITIGKTPYDAVSAPMVDMVNDWIKDVGGLVKDLAELGEGGEEKIGGDLRVLSMDVAAIFGIPAENVYNIVRGAVGNITDWAGIPQEWATDKSVDNRQMLNAYNNGHFDTAGKKMKQLLEAKVAAGKTEKEARSAMKSSVTTRFKPMYVAAYRKGNKGETERIRKIIQTTGLYDDVAKTLADWVK